MPVLQHWLNTAGDWLSPLEGERAKKRRDFVPQWFYRPFIGWYFILEYYSPQHCHNWLYESYTLKCCSLLPHWYSLSIQEQRALCVYCTSKSFIQAGHELVWMVVYRTERKPKNFSKKGWKIQLLFSTARCFFEIIHFVIHYCSVRHIGASQ